MLTLITSNLHFEQRSTSAINQNIYSFLTNLWSPHTSQSKYQPIFHAFHTAEIPDTPSGESGIRLQTNCRVVSASLLTFFSLQSNSLFIRDFPFNAHALTSKKLRVFSDLCVGSVSCFYCPPPSFTFVRFFVSASRFPLKAGHSRRVKCSAFLWCFFIAACVLCCVLCLFNVKC